MQNHRVAVVRKLLGFLLNTREDPVNQDDAAIFFVTRFLIHLHPPEGEPSPLASPHHRRDLDEKPLPSQVAFEVRRPRLGLGEKPDTGAGANQVGRQFQFGERRFLHTGVVVGEAVQKPA